MSKQKMYTLEEWYLKQIETTKSDKKKIEYMKLLKLLRGAK